MKATVGSLISEPPTNTLCRRIAPSPNLSGETRIPVCKNTPGQNRALGCARSNSAAVRNASRFVLKRQGKTKGQLPKRWEARDGGPSQERGKRISAAVPGYVSGLTSPKGRNRMCTANTDTVKLSRRTLRKHKAKRGEAAEAGIQPDQQARAQKRRKQLQKRAQHLKASKRPGGLPVAFI